MTVTTELRDDLTLGGLLAWCRERETLPLLSHGDLVLWARQNPVEYAAAIEEYGRLQQAPTGPAMDWVDSEDWSLGVDEMTVPTAPHHDASRDPALEISPAATSETPTGPGVRDLARRPGVRMFPWDPQPEISSAATSETPTGPGARDLARRPCVRMFPWD